MQSLPLACSRTIYLPLDQRRSPPAIQHATTLGAICPLNLPAVSLKLLFTPHAVHPYEKKCFYLLSEVHLKLYRYLSLLRPFRCPHSRNSERRTSIPCFEAIPFVLYMVYAGYHLSNHPVSLHTPWLGLHIGSLYLPASPQGSSRLMACYSHPQHHPSALPNHNPPFHVDDPLAAQASHFAGVEAMLLNLSRVIDTRFHPDVSRDTNFQPRNSTLNSRVTSIGPNLNDSSNAQFYELSVPAPLTTEEHQHNNPYTNNQEEPRTSHATQSHHCPQSSVQASKACTLGPVSEIRGLGLCHGQVMKGPRKGKPCTFKANPTHENLVCGHHKKQLQAVKLKISIQHSSSTSNPSESSSSQSARCDPHPIIPEHPQSYGARLSSTQQEIPSEPLPQAIDNLRSRSATSEYFAASEVIDRQIRGASAAKLSIRAIQPQNRVSAKRILKDLLNEYIPNHLTEDTQIAICNSLINSLPSSEQAGYIYCFEEPNLSSNAALCLKVGRSIDPEKRFKQWKTKRCGPDEPMVKFQKHVPYHIRIEHLVHLHLVDLSRNAQHLSSTFAEEWTTGPSIVQPRTPISKQNPFKYAGTYCRSCDCMHTELFLIERFCLSEVEEDEGREETPTRGERETVDVVERVLQYWTNVARRVWKQTSALCSA